MVNPQPRRTQPAHRARSACPVAAVVEQLVAVRPRRFGYVTGPADNHSSMSTGPGSWRALAAAGVVVPSDVSRVGFDGIEFADYDPEGWCTARRRSEGAPFARGDGGPPLPSGCCSRLSASLFLPANRTCRLSTARREQHTKSAKLDSCSQLKLTLPIDVNSATLGIGRHVSGIADPFNGHIDAFRIAHVQRSDGWIESTWM